MVHALQEGWRVLKTSGYLIDIRPLVSNPAVEILSNNGVFVAGQIDDSAGQEDDHAANNAVAEIVRQGLFHKQAEKQFQFAYYWDSLHEAKKYIENRWSDFARLPDHVVVKAQEISQKEKNARFRVRNKMKISRYKKLS